MPLRKRISLAAAGAVALVMAFALVACYVVVRDQQIGQLKDELRAEATEVQDGDTHTLLSQQFPQLSASAGGPAPYVQFVLQNGEAQRYAGDLTLPQTYEASAVASGTRPAYMTDVHVSGAHLEMYTFAVTGYTEDGMTTIAIQIARPLNAVDNVLSRLRLVLALMFLLGVGLAAVLGRIAARRVLSPLAEVTATAQLIGETDDLHRRLSVRADDEVGQLATRFNAMLERLAASRELLDESVRSQRQLVADASHELRTPVTSLRTNVEVLMEVENLDPEERRRLLEDVVEQSEELSTLVGDLIEVARGQLPGEDMEDLRLDQVVEDSLHRARRNSPELAIIARLQPTVVHGNAERLSRAVNNLLDNAAKHAGGGSVEVAVTASGVTVRDHGAGIAEEDLPHVFDRFYRGASSRGSQGSGLGLAIVRQVAELHGGSVSAANAPDGGAEFTLTLPGAPASDPGGDDHYADGGLVTRA